MLRTGSEPRPGPRAGPPAPCVTGKQTQKEWQAAAGTSQRGRQAPAVTWRGEPAARCLHQQRGDRGERVSHMTATGTARPGGRTQGRRGGDQRRHLGEEANCARHATWRDAALLEPLAGPMATSTARLHGLAVTQLQRAAPVRCAAARPLATTATQRRKSSRPVVVTAALVAPQEGVHDTPFHWRVPAAPASQAP